MDLFTIVIIAAIGLVVAGCSGIFLVPLLHKLKFGQTILDIGPKWHKEKKQGTPTMGGFMFILGTIIAFTCGMIMAWNSGLISFEASGKVEAFTGISGMIMAVCFAFIGFVDDFIKVKKKQNEGLTESQKLILQVLIVAAYFTSRVISGDTSTVINFPFLGQLDLWYFYYIIMGLGIIYIVNAVNLTDGIDGLCTSVTLVYLAAFIVILGLLGFTSLSVLAVAAAGSCLGFLIWNFPPAKVFMGDTGSMFLGGIVVALGVGSGLEVLMVICGAVYIWEALTVLIQTTYFRITHGKRLFKMTPIHHSFELRGWKEIKIDVVFSAITLVCGIVAILLVQGI